MLLRTRRLTRTPGRAGSRNNEQADVRFNPFMHMLVVQALRRDRRPTSVAHPSATDGLARQNGAVPPRVT
jgi:hypothetical protein